MNHATDGISPGTLFEPSRLPRPSTRFVAMKKAIKVILLIAIVGVIGKIIVDNA